MNCLRCGKRIAEGRSFCDDCLKVAAQPLEESPYLSSRIVLGQPRLAKSEPEPAPRTRQEESARQIRRLKRSCAMLSAACVLFALLCCLLCFLLLRVHRSNASSGPRVDPNLGSSQTVSDNADFPEHSEE